MASQTSETINRILAYIREHELQPGDVMPSEPTLKEQLGVSRSTLREALRELRTLHIVEVRHGLGSYVGHASLGFLSNALVFRTLAPGRDPVEGMRELVVLREMLEVGLAEHVVGRLTDDQVARLGECISQMNDDEDSAIADRRFHAVLYENVDNLIAIQLITAFWDAFDKIQDRLPQNPSIPATRKIHRDIVDAYSGGDVVAARQAMRNHFEFIKQRIADALAA